jgi:general secretion pathway protein I
VVSRDREETVAVLLARTKLDDPNFTFSEGAKGTFAPGWPDIRWETNLQATDFPWLKRGTLTVSWDGERRKISVAKYLSQ